MKILLAPMEGVLDYTLRDILTRVGGIDLCVSEFIRVTDRLLPQRVFRRLVPELGGDCQTSAGIPVIVQLLGNDPVALGENAVRAVEMGAPGIDLNFGCPAKTVNKSRGGAILLQDPEEVYAIASGVQHALAKAVPLTAKMRLGFYDKVLALENAQALEAAGVQQIVVHARTKVEGYRPPAHWEWIARIRESVAIPVVANGEVWTPTDFDRCREISGCRDVMIGRGLIANPFLALQIKNRVSGSASVGMVEASLWPQVLALVLDYHRLVMQRVQSRHVHGRTKQWLQMMKHQFPEAEQLFIQLRTERDAETIDGVLQRESDRLALQMDRQSA
jgi:tRNA-dihydrouridine synthase C